MDATRKSAQHACLQDAPAVLPKSWHRAAPPGLLAGRHQFIALAGRVGCIEKERRRVRALLRRGYPEAAGIQAFGPYQVNPDNATLTLNGEAVELTKREFDLAYFMFRNAGRLVSRRHLQEAVWRTKSEIPSRSLDTYMSRLRSKLAVRPENGYRLVSVYGQGYRLEANASSEDGGEAI